MTSLLLWPRVLHPGPCNRSPGTPSRQRTRRGRIGDAYLTSLAPRPHHRDPDCASTSGYARSGPLNRGKDAASCPAHIRQYERPGRSGSAALRYPELRAFWPTLILVAIWRSKDGNRFQNYKSLFTILNVESVSRSWISALRNGEVLLDDAPAAWARWVATGRYDAVRRTGCLPTGRWTGWTCRHSCWESPRRPAASTTCIWEWTQRS
ncbi:MAG: hypothetical protein ACR2N9_07835, partial [Acidimicrobiia bacterium]